MGLKRYYFSIIKGIKSLGIICCVLLLIFEPLQAQDESLELIESSNSNDTDTPGQDDQGPTQSTTVTFIYNEDNTGNTTYSTYLPQTEVTFTFSNEQSYGTTVNQDSDNSGLIDGDDPAAVIGWTFNEIGTGDDYIREGSDTEINATMNSLSQSIPATPSFSSLEGTIGNGIDIDINTAIFMSVSFEPLREEDFLDQRYRMVDLTIDFSEPVTNPVLHFVGLGGVWTRNFGGTLYVNTATTDFELISFTAGSGSLTLSKLSGTATFEVDNSSSPKMISNNAPVPDYENTSFSGVGTGSALIEGEDITSLTFRLYARAMTSAGSSNANNTTIGAEFGNTTWGWSGVEGDDSSEQFPEINFAADRFMIGISTPVQVDETLLTVAECYRMLSAPVEGTTYATLLDPIWTQGMPGADYTSGDPNVWLWPDEPGASDGDWEGVPDLGNIIAPGSGFLVSVYSDDDYTNSPADTGFDKTLSVTGSENAPLTFTAMNDDDSGWTLLGNPFKSPLHIATTNDGIFEGTTQDVVETVYIWNRNTESGDGGDNSTGGLPGSWITGTSAGGGDIFNDDGTIAAFQGFFVQNNGSNPQVDFRDASKATDGTFYGKEKSLSNFARFELNGEGLYNSMWLQFSNEGSLEKSITDALELQPMSPEYAMLGTKKADGTIYDIGHYPIPDDAFEIPVSLETTRSGYFTITATDLDLSFGADLYFIDLVKKESIRIDENFSYQFSTEAVAKVPGGDQFNRCSVNSPQKAKTFATADRFMIATQPRDFVEIPVTVALNQNYPNPFNPTTQISYDLPQTADVRLEVYDLVGRQVATLVNQTMEAGSHSVNFDASNLSSGVYIYRLNAGNMVLSRKLTVIK